MSRHISSQNYQIIRVGGGTKTYLRDSEYTEFNTYRGQHNNEESSLIETLAATDEVLFWPLRLTLHCIVSSIN